MLGSSISWASGVNDRLRCCAVDTTINLLPGAYTIKLLPLAYYYGLTTTKLLPLTHYNFLAQ